MESISTMRKWDRIKIVLYIALTALGVVSCIIYLIKNFDGGFMSMVALIDTIVILLTALYAFAGYKKPHGNLLKNLMLFFTISLMMRVLYCASSGITLLASLNMLIIVMIAYVAGRLDRIDQNKYLMSVILVLFVAARIAFEVSGAAPFDLLLFLGSSTGLIIWLDICCAYFLRYYQHKEAGLAD